MRSLPEWIGATPDAKVPPRVRLRVFERAGGVCHISGRKIAPGDRWDLDHVVALVNGGENRESNLAPALRNKHKEKTKDDVKEKARIAAKAKKHVGVKKPKATIKSRGFETAAKASRIQKQPLAPRQLYQRTSGN